MPFPETGYRPRKTDYLSAYLLMALTDLFAIAIVLHLIRAEKRGDIVRHGKIEAEASR